MVEKCKKPDRLQDVRVPKRGYYYFPDRKIVLQLLICMQDEKNGDFLLPAALIKDSSGKCNRNASGPIFLPCVLMSADIFLPVHTGRLLREEKEKLSCTQFRTVKLFILTGTKEDDGMLWEAIETF